MSKKFAIPLGGIGLLVLLAGAWCAWTAWQVNQDLSDAVDDAESFRQAVQDGDQAAVSRELAELQESSGAAVDGTSGATWSALTHLPVVGDDATGVRVTSEVVHDLSEDGLQPLADVSDRLDELLPKDGAVPVDVIAELEEPVARAEQAFADADARLDAEDSSGYTTELKTRYRDLQEQVHDAAAAMSSARRAVDVLPTMLGGEEPRRFLLVFQNNAEVRATGGLPGAVSVVEAADGRLEITRQVGAGSLGRAPEPVLPITPAERKLYDDVPASYFVSANMTPDVPRVADLMRAHWQRAYPDDQIDGVILIDTVALSYVLEATGPLEVEGVTISADNVVDELLHNTYLRLPDPQAQDAFFAAVASAAFERFSAGAADPTELIRGLARATDERRVFVHSFDEAEQQALSDTLIAGELVTDPANESPQVTITTNDTTGAKMSYFLRTEVDVSTTYCTDGVQGLAAKMRLHSDAPPNAADLPFYVTGGGEYLTDPGNQLVTVRIYGPVGGRLSEVELNAKPIDLVEVDQDGRPVGMTYIELKPGQTVDLAWSMTSGEGQTDDAEVTVTPSIEAGAVGRQVASAC